jgi:hypothetical protein
MQSNDDHISYQDPDDSQKPKKRKMPFGGKIVVGILLLIMMAAFGFFLHKKYGLFWSAPSPSGSVPKAAVTKTVFPEPRDSSVIIAFMHSKTVVNGKGDAAVILSVRDGAGEKSDSSVSLRSVYFLLPDSMVSRKLLLSCPPAGEPEGWATVRYRQSKPRSVELSSYDWYRLEKEYIPPR